LQKTIFLNLVFISKLETEFDLDLDLNPDPDPQYCLEWNQQTPSYVLHQTLNNTLVVTLANSPLSTAFASDVLTKTKPLKTPPMEPFWRWFSIHHRSHAWTWPGPSSVDEVSKPFHTINLPGR
jgi:hypothetical protein